MPANLELYKNMYRGGDSQENRMLKNFKSDWWT